MNAVKLTRYYVIQELTPEKTFKILKEIKSINVTKLEDLEKGIRSVRKVVKIAVGRRFKCSNSELVEAFLKIIDTLPLQQYYEITKIAENLDKTRQK